MKYLNPAFVDFHARRVLHSFIRDYPAAKIDPSYTVGTIEGADETDGGCLTIQISIDLGTRKQRIPFWERLRNLF